MWAEELSSVCLAFLFREAGSPKPETLTRFSGRRDEKQEVAEGGMEGRYSLGISPPTFILPLEPLEINNCDPDATDARRPSG